LEHGVSLLRDSGKPEIPSSVRIDVRRHAEETVAAIKEQVFPLLAGGNG
jgi:hypothetical protein